MIKVVMWDDHGSDAGMIMAVMEVVTMPRSLEIVLLCSVNLNKCCNWFEK